MKSFYLSFVLLLLSLGSLFAQADSLHKITINGEIHDVYIKGKDTLILAKLNDVSFTSPRKFNSKEERDRYFKLRRSADKVYPFAIEAITLYRGLKEATDGMSDKKRRKFAKKIKKAIDGDIEHQLVNLTKTQGTVLIKMIERELDTPFFDVIKELRGGFTAFYWNQFGKIYDYDLKAGYDAKKDPMLEGVLQDYPID